MLEENASVINVEPLASLDPGRGFLIADRREGQIRGYTAAGKLRFFKGRRGQGPGEFQSLSGVFRRNDGTIVAIDGVRLTFFDSTATRVIGTQAHPFTRIFYVEAVSDSTLLVSGIRTQEVPERVHLWNFVRNATRSFFVPPVARYPQAEAAAGLVVATAYSDTILVTYAFSDTVYILNKLGDRLGQVPVRGTAYRKLSEPPPRQRGGMAVREWYGTFSLMAGAYKVGDTFLVQYQDRKNLLPQWRLAAITESGDLLFDWHPGPRIVLRAEQPGEFYFNDVADESVNVWSKGSVLLPEQR